MPVYRKATLADAENVALLHTANWQLHYNAILDDYYLEHEVLADRKKVWQTRLKDPDPNMCLILAEEATQLIGFGCLFFQNSEEYGALLDNLHVDNAYSGRGTGKALMSLLAEEVLQRAGRKDMYLWVLEDNLRAIQFYEKLQGQRREKAIEKELGSKPVDKLRYYWPDVTELIVTCKD